MSFSNRDGLLSFQFCYFSLASRLQLCEAGIILVLDTISTILSFEFTHMMLLSSAPSLHVSVHHINIHYVAHMHEPHVNRSC